MKDEKENTALVKYEPQPQSLIERFEAFRERKRQELREALEQGQVAEPISGGILTSLLISGIVSTASAGIGGPIARALMPKKGKPC